MIGVVLAVFAGPTGTVAMIVIMLAAVAGGLWTTNGTRPPERILRGVVAVLFVWSLFGAWSFYRLGTLADDVRRSTDANCSTAQSFRSLLADLAERELTFDVLRRDDLENQLELARARDLPGSSQLTDEELAELIARGEQQLAERNAEIEQEEVAVAAIRGFVFEIECPPLEGSTPTVPDLAPLSVPASTTTGP